jgi:hypothetical protein
MKKQQRSRFKTLFKEKKQRKQCFKSRTGAEASSRELTFENFNAHYYL